MSNLDDKRNRLLAELEKYETKDIVLAFSGGVDSGLLLELLCRQAAQSGTLVYAVLVQTELHPRDEMFFHAGEIAEAAGAIFSVLEYDGIDEPGIRNNPKDRCYRCKKYMFSRLLQIAEERDAGCVMDGTNSDDLQQYRPGIAALRELSIVSPLADAGITKSDVRELAGELGLVFAEKPSTPCLATRFPYGMRLSRRAFRAVEDIENTLRKAGFYNVRARIHKNLVRIEVDCEDVSALVMQRGALIDLVRRHGYPYVTVDMMGFRSGSMDEGMIR